MPLYSQCKILTYGSSFLRDGTGWVPMVVQFLMPIDNLLETFTDIATTGKGVHLYIAFQACRGGPPGWSQRFLRFQKGSRVGPDALGTYRKRSI